MKNYKLLTPGPLTTSDAVKAEMLFDHCTWDNEYKAITQKILVKEGTIFLVNDTKGSGSAENVTSSMLETSQP